MLSKGHIRNILGTAMGFNLKLSRGVERDVKINQKIFFAYRMLKSRVCNI